MAPRGNCGLGKYYRLARKVRGPSMDGRACLILYNGLKYSMCSYIVILNKVYNAGLPETAESNAGS